MLVMEKVRECLPAAHPWECLPAAHPWSPRRLDILSFWHLSTGNRQKEAILFFPGVELQPSDAELGSCEQTHISPVPVTQGNSITEQSLAPFPEWLCYAWR